MKKIIAPIILAAAFAPALMAEISGPYVGFDILSSGNTLSVEYDGHEDEFDDNSAGFKLKFGALFFNNWRLQAYFLHENYEDPLFDASNDAMNEIGADLIKGFEVAPGLLPFFQIGLGVGWMDVDGYNKDSLSSVSFKFGGGVMYRVTPAFEVLAGLDIQGRAWEEIDYGTTTVEPSESSTKFYLGANLHF